MHEIKEIIQVAIPALSAGGLGALIGLPGTRARWNRVSGLAISRIKGRQAAAREGSHVPGRPMVPTPQESRTANESNLPGSCCVVHTH